MRWHLSHVYCHGSAVPKGGGFQDHRHSPSFRLEISPEFPRFPVYQDTDRACVTRRVTVASTAACISAAARALETHRWSLTSLQQRLVKTGGRLVTHARYYWLLLAESHLTRRLFGSMLRRIWALPVPAGDRQGLTGQSWRREGATQPRCPRNVEHVVPSALFRSALRVSSWWDWCDKEFCLEDRSQV
jgi:hypothetical protein